MEECETSGVVVLGKQSGRGSSSRRRRSIQRERCREDSDQPKPGRCPENSLGKGPFSEALKWHLTFAATPMETKGTIQNLIFFLVDSFFRCFLKPF